MRKQYTHSYFNCQILSLTYHLYRSILGLTYHKINFKFNSIEKILKQTQILFVYSVFNFFTERIGIFGTTRFKAVTVILTNNV